MGYKQLRGGILSSLLWYVQALRADNVGKGSGLRRTSGQWGDTDGTQGYFGRPRGPREIRFSAYCGYVTVIPSRYILLCDSPS